MKGTDRLRFGVFWLRVVLYLLVVAGVAVTVLPALNTSAWWIRVLDFPRLQFTVALAILLVLLLVLPGRFRWTSVAVSAAALICLVWQAVVLFPYSPIPSPRMQSAAECPSTNRLRVVAVNVQMTNENAERLFASLRLADPDLILLQETDEWWDERLRALSDRWPHAAQHITQNYFGMHIRSKYPLLDPQIHFLTSSRNPSIFTGVTLPSGDAIRFYGIHPRPPLAGQSSAERDGQLLGAALAIRDEAAPAVAAGDFNAVPWEDVEQRMERVAGLLAPRVGRGWVPTFKTNSLLVTWPLDHVLAGPRFTLGTIEALPNFGSDHYPIMAALCFTPGAATQQAAAPLEAGDIEAAQEALAAAQNRAGPSPEPAEGKQVPQRGPS